MSYPSSDNTMKEDVLSHEKRFPDGIFSQFGFSLDSATDCVYENRHKTECHAKIFDSAVPISFFHSTLNIPISHVAYKRYISIYDNMDQGSDCLIQIRNPITDNSIKPFERILCLHEDYFSPNTIPLILTSEHELLRCWFDTTVNSTLKKVTISNPNLQLNYVGADPNHPNHIVGVSSTNLWKSIIGDDWEKGMDIAIPDKYLPLVGKYLWEAIEAYPYALEDLNMLLLLSYKTGNMFIIIDNDVNPIFLREKYVYHYEVYPYIDLRYREDANFADCYLYTDTKYYAISIELGTGNTLSYREFSFPEDKYPKIGHITAVHRIDDGEPHSDTNTGVIIYYSSGQSFAWDYAEGIRPSEFYNTMGLTAIAACDNLTPFSGINEEMIIVGDVGNEEVEYVTNRASNVLVHPTLGMSSDIFIDPFSKNSPIIHCAIKGNKLVLITKGNPEVKIYSIGSGTLKPFPSRANLDLPPVPIADPKEPDAYSDLGHFLVSTPKGILLTSQKQNNINMAPIIKLVGSSWEQIDGNNMAFSVPIDGCTISEGAAFLSDNFSEIYLYLEDKKILSRMTIFYQNNEPPVNSITNIRYCENAGKPFYLIYGKEKMGLVRVSDQHFFPVTINEKGYQILYSPNPGNLPNSANCNSFELIGLSHGGYPFKATISLEDSEIGASSVRHLGLIDGPFMGASFANNVWYIASMQKLFVSRDSKHWVCIPNLSFPNTVDKFYAVDDGLIIVASYPHNKIQYFKI